MNGCAEKIESEDDVQHFLILYRASILITNDVATKIAELDINLVIISASCTWLYQSVDVCWVKFLKDKSKVHWNKFIRLGKTMKKDKLRNSSKQDVPSWVSKS